MYAYVLESYGKKEPGDGSGLEQINVIRTVEIYPFRTVDPSGK
jgi:hypothetical protein